MAYAAEVVFTAILGQPVPHHFESDVQRSLRQAAWHLLRHQFPYQGIDRHGRMDESDIGDVSQPFVQGIAERVASSMCLTVPESRWKWRITVDVDQPFLLRGKPFARQLASWLKSEITPTDKHWRGPKRGAIRGNDPYDVYDFLLHQVPPQNLFFFFLVENGHHHDEWYSWHVPAYQKLIKRLSETGATIGLHPSYAAGDNPHLIGQQKKILEDIIGRQVEDVRMHFLRLPDDRVREAMADCGLKNDHTTPYARHWGFKGGMALPYPWFSRLRQQKSNLTLMPTMAMDRAMEQRGLTAEEATEQMLILADETWKAGGEFSLLLHNTTLSETGEWRGWKQSFLDVLGYLKARDRAARQI